MTEHNFEKYQVSCDLETQEVTFTPEFEALMKALGDQGLNADYPEIALALDEGMTLDETIKMVEAEIEDRRQMDRSWMESRDFDYSMNG